jgi:hypothetical protein
MALVSRIVDALGIGLRHGLDGLNAHGEAIFPANAQGQAAVRVE